LQREKAGRGHIRQLKPFATAITQKKVKKKAHVFARFLKRAKT